jgi:hypothetical protein
VIRARTGRPPAAEIEEIIWIEAASVPDILIAPLTRDHILPLHRRAWARVDRTDASSAFLGTSKLVQPI